MSNYDVQIDYFIMYITHPWQWGGSLILDGVPIKIIRTETGAREDNTEKVNLRLYEPESTRRVPWSHWRDAASIRAAVENAIREFDTIVIPVFEKEHSRYAEVNVTPNAVIFHDCEDDFTVTYARKPDGSVDMESRQEQKENGQ
jgi:hypothetical protein